MISCKFTRIDYQSSRYLDELRLRYQVLRRPLGLTLDDIDPAEEARMLHFGLLDDGLLVACVLALPAQAHTAVIRQMAVAEPYRGRGLGTQLLKHAERQLQLRGITDLSLSARTNAIPFYQRAGYLAHGKVYLSVTLPHRKMRKKLTTNHHGDRRTDSCTVPAGKR